MMNGIQKNEKACSVLIGSSVSVVPFNSVDRGAEMAVTNPPCGSEKGVFKVEPPPNRRHKETRKRFFTLFSVYVQDNFLENKKDVCVIVINRGNSFDAPVFCSAFQAYVTDGNQT